MRVILKRGALVIAPETQEERDAFVAWREASAGHLFSFDGGSAKGGALLDLGARADVLQEPINILFEAGDPRWHPISNLAETPFTFRGRSYASVEGFWQGLKFESEDQRTRVAALWGVQAKRAGAGAPPLQAFTFDGALVSVGGPGHRRLMLQACREKFQQDASARAALLATGERPLTHRARRDSETIPGALMADIWMRVRAMLRRPELVDETAAAAISASADDGRILYFARDRAAFRFLSHFHLSPIELDGQQWPTVEHYYQAQKSFDPGYREAICAAATPGAAKKLASSPATGSDAAGGRVLRSGHVARADWFEVKLDIMRRADRAKFTQHPDLGARLLATGDAVLIEDSPSEPFWGTGPDGAGLNWAGRVLMELREQLSAASRP